MTKTILGTFERFALFIFVLILFPVLIPAQEQNFNVEYSRIEGKLSKNDLVKQDFGRYDGYQLPMNKGEYAYFIVYSGSFSPSLILLTPDDKIYQQVSANGEDFTSFGINVPFGGEWILYVLGDSLSTGDYFLQLSFSDSASLSVNPDADFCTGLDYLVAHANAYFIFPQSLPTNEPLYQLEGSNNSFINGEDASYNSVYYQGNKLNEAEETYNSLVDKVNQCIDLQGWTKNSSDWETVEELSEMKVLFSEKDNSNGNNRIIEITLTDLSKATDADYPNDYMVELVITKK